MNDKDRLITMLLRAKISFREGKDSIIIEIASSTSYTEIFFDIHGMLQTIESYEY